MPRKQKTEMATLALVMRVLEEQPEDARARILEYVVRCFMPWHVLLPRDTEPK